MLFKKNVIQKSHSKMLLLGTKKTPSEKSSKKCYSLNDVKKNVIRKKCYSKKCYSKKMLFKKMLFKKKCYSKKSFKNVIARY